MVKKIIGFLGFLRALLAGSLCAELLSEKELDGAGIDLRSGPLPQEAKRARIHLLP